MPHRHSAEASDRRRTRARELGLLQPRTAGHSHLLVREDLKPRVQAMVHSLALHEAHACGAGRPYHYARQASLAASLSPEALQHALEVHRLANRAKHAWNSPRPGTAAAAAAAAHPGSSSTKEDADPVWENDPWAAATSLSSSGCTSPPAKDDCGRTANVASPSCSPIGWIVLAPVYADAEIQKVVGQASLQILRQLQGSEASATAECGTSEGSFVDALDERSQVRQGSMPFASSEVRLRSEVGTPIIKNLPDEVKPLRPLFCDSGDDLKAESPTDNEMCAVDSKKPKKHNQKDDLHTGDGGKVFGSFLGSAFDTDGELSHEFHMHDDMQDDIEASRQWRAFNRRGTATILALDVPFGDYAVARPGNTVESKEFVREFLAPGNVVAAPVWGKVPAFPFDKLYKLEESATAEIATVDVFVDGYTIEEWQAWHEQRLSSRHGYEGGGRIEEAAVEEATAVATAAVLEEATAVAGMSAAAAPSIEAAAFQAAVKASLPQESAVKWDEAADWDQESVASWEVEQMEIVDLYGEGYTREEWQAWHELRLSSRHDLDGGGRIEEAAAEEAAAVATAAVLEEATAVAGRSTAAAPSIEAAATLAAVEAPLPQMSAVKLEEAADLDQDGAKWLAMCTAARALPGGAQALFVDKMRELLPPLVWQRIELTARAMDDV